MAGLARYASSTSQPIGGNLAEARKGLTGAREALQRGSAALSGGDRRAAARSAATAEEGLTGATHLLDAIDKLAATANDAEMKLEEALAAAEDDLAGARQGLVGLAPAGSRKEDELRAADAAHSGMLASQPRGPPSTRSALRTGTRNIMQVGGLPCLVHCPSCPP